MPKKTKAVELVGVHMMAYPLAWQKEISLVCQKKVPNKLKAVGLLGVHILAYLLV